jgi:hypothetical protein
MSRRHSSFHSGRGRASAAPNKVEKSIDINVDDLTLLTTLVVVNIEVSVSWLATSMAKSSPYYEVSASTRQGSRQKLTFCAAIKGPGNTPPTSVALLNI